MHSTACTRHLSLLIWHESSLFTWVHSSWSRLLSHISDCVCVCVCCDLSTCVQRLQLPQQLLCLNHCASHEGHFLLLLDQLLQHLLHLWKHTRIEMGLIWLRKRCRQTSVITPAGSSSRSAAAAGTAAASGGASQRSRRTPPPCLWAASGAWNTHTHHAVMGACLPFYHAMSFCVASLHLWTVSMSPLMSCSSSTSLLDAFTVSRLDSSRRPSFTTLRMSSWNRKKSQEMKAKLLEATASTWQNKRRGRERVRKEGWGWRSARNNLHLSVSMCVWVQQEVNGVGFVREFGLRQLRSKALQQLGDLLHCHSKCLDSLWINDNTRQPL